MCFSFVGYHATGGYLTVSSPPYSTPLGRAFIQAGIQMGYPNVDINGPTMSGELTINIIESFIIVNMFLSGEQILPLNISLDRQTIHQIVGLIYLFIENFFMCISLRK